MSPDNNISEDFVKKLKVQNSWLFVSQINPLGSQWYSEAKGEQHPPPEGSLSVTAPHRGLHHSPRVSRVVTLARTVRATCKDTLTVCGDVDAVLAVDVKDEVLAGMIYSALGSSEQELRGCGARYTYYCVNDMIKVITKTRLRDHVFLCFSRLFTFLQRNRVFLHKTR